MRSCDKEKGRKYVALVAQGLNLPLSATSHTNIQVRHGAVSTPGAAVLLSVLVHHSQPPPTSSRSYTIPSHLLPPADPTPFPATSYLQQILHHSQPPPTSSRSIPGSYHPGIGSGELLHADSQHVQLDT
ncbi:hypothetical protein Pmani_010424 [Petrolisthes manimaculis]|uniref:Uncharacterized protein n=1 Tax=Petrolisthes manimaculis TaxID=1843537 RepID=A0AAE1UHA9_9EUCA|nr:hypothetical protein Pmani_010424 [Petrolisthes manimaculis]